MNVLFVKILKLYFVSFKKYSTLSIFNVLSKVRQIQLSLNELHSEWNYPLNDTKDD